MKGLLENQGYSAMVIDIGPLGPPGIRPDVSNEEVAQWEGLELSTLIQTGERDRIMEEMGKGL